MSRQHGLEAFLCVIIFPDPASNSCQKSMVVLVCSQVVIARRYGIFELEGGAVLSLLVRLSCLFVCGG